MVSGEHGGHECDGFLFSLSRRHTRNYCWHHLVVLAGSGNLCPLLSKICRVVAIDLRGRGDDCPLSECVRFDRPTFSESAIFESSGANSNRTGISGRAALDIIDFHLADNCSGD